MHRHAVSTAAALILLALSLGAASAALQDQPAVLNSVAPAYPPIARAARAAGEIVVEAKIDAKGNVSSAEAPSGHPLLQQASKDAALRWRFEPGAGGMTVRLTFEFVLEQADKEPKSDSPYRVIIRRPKGPDTVSHIPQGAEDKTCEVHGFKLEKDKVGIVYGLMIVEPEADEAQKTLFPNSNGWAVGGCEVSDESPKYAEVLYCRACRAAEQKWQQERRPKPDGR